MPLETNGAKPRILADALVDVPVDILSSALLRRGRALSEYAEADLLVAPRDEKREVLRSLVSKAGSELARLSEAPTDVEHAARAVRNIFEVNLVVRYVLADQENLMLWMKLRVAEEIDVLKRLVKLQPDGHPATPVVLGRVQECERFLSKRGLDAPKRLPAWAELARDHGAGTDYDALYGVYSKYIHPSAWNLVQPDPAWDPMFAAVFVAHAQVYAADASTRTAGALAVPDTRVAQAFSERPAEPG